MDIPNECASLVMHILYFCSGTVECQKPIGLLSHKLGIQYITNLGKPAWTTFERMSYNGNSSVVRCELHIQNMYASCFK